MGGGQSESRPKRRNPLQRMQLQGRLYFYNAANGYLHNAICCFLKPSTESHFKSLAFPFYIDFVASPSIATSFGIPGLAASRNSPHYTLTANLINDRPIRMLASAFGGSITSVRPLIGEIGFSRSRQNADLNFNILQTTYRCCLVY